MNPETKANRDANLHSAEAPIRLLRPFVSVVMPVRNEARSIASSLGSILVQDYPPHLMEIIVADGMSDDATYAIVKAAGRSDSRISLFANTDQTTPTGLNAAIRRSKGSVIVRVDGHCELASDYIRRCVEVLCHTHADAVGGKQEACGVSPVGRAIALVTTTPFGIGNSRFRYADRGCWVDTVYLGAYRRKVFDHVGYFDEDLVKNQDDEFNFRLRQAGGRIRLDPTIKAVYRCRSSLGGLFAQYYEYGRYKVRVMQKRKAILSVRHIVPATFVASCFASVIGGIATGSGLVLLPVLGTYILANCVCSMYAARRAWSLLPLLPICYLALHSSYGLGFIVGLYTWRRHHLSTVSCRQEPKAT